MSIVTFYNSAREQTGQTMSAIAIATNMAIQHNIKILLISTSLNDDTIKNSFWHEKPNLLSGIFGSNANVVNQSGIEGLDRVVRSNKISPDIIKDYTKVVLKNRLEVLLGVTGTEEQYSNIYDQYLEIVIQASKYYDFVFVDLDKNLSGKVKREILKCSDIIVPIVSQNLITIQNNIDFFKKVPEISIQKAIFTIGKYNENTKYNAKNISRNIFKSKDLIDIIPYNVLLFEAAQEGRMVDLLLDFTRLKGKDENTTFLSELSNTGTDIKNKLSLIRK